MNCDVAVNSILAFSGFQYCWKAYTTQQKVYLSLTVFNVVMQKFYIPTILVPSIQVSEGEGDWFYSVLLRDSFV